MIKKLNCILLVDDNEWDNRFHQIVIERVNCAENIRFAENGQMALDFLNAEKLPPELIFLDINMPLMNGWEFLDEYKNLDSAKKARIIIMMLTTSYNPEDRKRAEQIAEVTGFQVKPLTEDTLKEILEEHFS